MCKGSGVHFAEFYLIYLKYLSETKLFHFHGIFKNGVCVCGGGGGGGGGWS